MVAGVVCRHGKLRECSASSSRVGHGVSINEPAIDKPMKIVAHVAIRT
jgi:hypothetical protein